MSERFGPLAAALSGIAARDLRWRPDEFWRATPSELAAALGPINTGNRPIGSGSGPIDRAVLQHLMEQDHG